MLRVVGDGILLPVKVVPRAGKSAVAGTRDEALLVRLAAAPVDGAANEELVAVMADALDVPRRAITIASGERSRRKTLLVRGISLEDARAKLHLTG